MILLYGPAGSGKTTQGRIMAEKHGWKFVSAGDLLREKAKTDRNLATIMTEGNLVPSGIVNELIFNVADPVGGGHIIIDGYPRETEELEDLVERYGSSMIAVAVVFELSEVETINRLKLRGRSDDDEAGIKRRLDIYHQEMSAILELLDKHQVRVLRVDASPSVEEISDNLDKELQKWQVIT
ncbi:nucleoside monophosphate kinase [Candidatus Saccharibacteria bacterium]|nr:nucleoside monophosphate kinase [Candidatus Saccharibacteria bacterium]